MAARNPSVEFPTAAQRSEDETQLIRSVKIPNFSFPYPPECNSHDYVGKVVAQAGEWMVHKSVDKLFSTTTWQKFMDSDLTAIATVTYFDAGENELLWLCKFLLWLFAFDDLLDEAENFSSPEETVSLFLDLNLVLLWVFPDDFTLVKNFGDFMADVKSNREGTLDYVHSKLKEAKQHPGTFYDTSTAGPFCQAFGDLWQELVSVKPGECSLQVSIYCQTYLIANVQEIRNRRNHTIPSVAAYIPLRRESVATKLLLVLVAFADKVDIPKKLWDSYEMQQLLTLNADITGWQNDMYSFKKEILLGDVHNLVVVLSHERGYSYSEAMEVAFKMTMQRVQDQDRACADLELVTPAEHRFAISRFTKTCRHMPASYDVWHLESSRYGG